MNSTSLSSRLLIISSSSSSLLLNLFSLFFSSMIIFFSCVTCLGISYIFYLCWSSQYIQPFFPKLGEHLYEQYFELFFRYIIYFHLIEVSFWILILFFYLEYIPLFPHFVWISVFCFYILGKTVNSPSLEGVASYRRWILLFNLALVLGCLLNLCGC